MKREDAEKMVADYKRACRNTISSDVKKKIQFGPIKKELEKQILAALIKAGIERG